MAGLIIVVDAAVQVQANQLAAQLDPAGGDATFTVSLVPAGSLAGAVPTAYWCCSASMDQAHIDQANAVIAQAIAAGALQASQVHVFRYPDIGPDDVLAQLGLQRPVVAV